LEATNNVGTKWNCIKYNQLINVCLTEYLSKSHIGEYYGDDSTEETEEGSHWK